MMCPFTLTFFFFFFNDPAPTEIYPLPLHDALPISGTGETTGKLSRSRNASSFLVRQPTQWVMPPPAPAATTRPPARTNSTTRASSAAYRLRGGSSTTSSAGGVPRGAARAKSNSGVRRRSTGTRNRASTSYTARLPSGPQSKLDVRKSNCGVVPRVPAAIATLTARASASASQSSSRRDMGEHRVGCGPECLVGGGVAGHGAEYVAVQTGHEIGERRATPLVETSFAHEFGTGLRRMDRERPLLFQLEQQGDKAIQIGRASCRERV